MSARQPEREVISIAVVHIKRRGTVLAVGVNGNELCTISVPKGTQADAVIAFLQTDALQEFLSACQILEI